MSLETLCVKNEAEVCVKEEPREQCVNEETGTHVKEEGACADSAALCGLYAGHQVKDELVLGPVELHRPCVSSALPATPNRVSGGVGRACRAGPRTYTLRRAREPSDCTDTAAERFQCHHCGKDFLNKDAIRKHVQKHLPEPSTCSNKSPETHPKKNLVNCSQCNYTTRYKNHLRIHQRIHTGEKPFQCSRCDFKFSQKSNLRVHERIHTGVKPFKCSQCDYKCNQKSHVQYHERIHTGEKPFKCRHCDYKCSLKENFERHKRIHTGEKPFKCSHCDYKCRDKSNLQRHQRIHAGKKPFSM